MKRTDILDTAAEYISKDRESTYGAPEDNFGLIARYWSTHLGVEVSATDVALMMTLLKIARLKHTPGSADGWVDAAGYMACGGEIALRE
jgi:hypothetical protein